MIKMSWVQNPTSFFSLIPMLQRKCQTSFLVEVVEPVLPPRPKSQLDDSMRSGIAQEIRIDRVECDTLISGCLLSSTSARIFEVSSSNPSRRKRVFISLSWLTKDLIKLLLMLTG